MTTVFLDTSGWLAALVRREAAHREASAAYREWMTRRMRLVTTNLVLAEMHTLLLRFRGTTAAADFLQNVHLDPLHEVVYVDRELERAATERWLRRYVDQTFSLTDALSFEVMRSRRIRGVLTLDEHFTVAGFERFPRH